MNCLVASLKQRLIGGTLYLEFRHSILPHFTVLRNDIVYDYTYSDKLKKHQCSLWFDGNYKPTLVKKYNKLNFIRIKLI